MSHVDGGISSRTDVTRSLLQCIARERGRWGIKRHHLCFRRVLASFRKERLEEVRRDSSARRCQTRPHFALRTRTPDAGQYHPCAGECVWLPQLLLGTSSPAHTPARTVAPLLPRSHIRIPVLATRTVFVAECKPPQGQQAAIAVASPPFHPVERTLSSRAGC